MDRNGTFLIKRGIMVLLLLLLLLEIDKYVRTCIIYLFFFLDDLYSPVEYLKHLVQIYKLPENSIKYIGGIFSSEDMNLLYNIADLIR